MKCTIPEISWHNREPVLSIDIHPISEKFYRLATGGADCHVLIWQLNICDNGAVKLETLADLTRHQRAVNSVRWSPTGQYLATADDDANIIVWQLKTDNIPLLEGESNDKEIWIVHKVMRGHKEDIYDVCWSPNSLKLLSGSVDNTAILWDLTKGKSDNILTDHKGFVQGVSWDPKGHYIATISTDRVCRVFESSGKQVKARIQKGYLQVPENHYLHNKEVKFFHDDTFKSFFRRLDFSPDGTLLAVPSGRVEVEDCKKILNATYIFAVDSWAGPVAVFQSGKQCSTVVRFCPILFELHEDGPEAIISLPFRMIVAVGTDHDVILYDTQQQVPFAYFRDIHYTRLTDLTWSKDGLLLVAASTDGYCALITFEPNELGVQYIKEESETEDNVMEISGCEELEKDGSNVDATKEKIITEITPAKPRKPSLLEKWTIKTPKSKKKHDNTNMSINDTVIKGDDVNKEVSSVEDDTTKRKLIDDSGKVIRKRIKPVPVPDEKNNSNNPVVKPIVKRREDCTKVSPLLSFLKAAPKDKLCGSKKIKTPAVLQPVDVILDEIEARDAWKCDKDENKSFNENKNVLNVDDYTEDFSLHLEDSTTKECDKEISKNQNDNTELTHKSKDFASTHVKNKSTIELGARKKGEKWTEHNDKTDLKNSGELKDCSESDELTNVFHGDNKSQIVSTKTVNPSESTDAKVSVPKRRIPLITLSSPKHKKK